jgi:peptidoglycan/LPS O-acetylase OafA/YrhL
MNTSLVSHPVDTTATDSTATSGRYVRAGVVAGLAAAAANLAVAAVARQFDVDLKIDSEAIPLLGFPQVTLMAAVVGVVLAAVLARRARHPRHTFVVTTVILTALSLMPPVLVEASTATRLVLEVTHLLAAFVVIPAIAARLAD